MRYKLFKKEKTPIFIKPKLKDHYNSFYERLVDIYRAFIEFNSHWWNNTFFGNKTFQKISFSSSIFTFFLLILVRDVFLIDIPKIIFIIFIGVSLLVLEKKYVYWAFVFLIPFSNALPVTYIALIFAIVLFIKNKCRINILQIVVPSLILLAEILLIKHHGYSNYSSAFTLFLFIFNGSYLVFERDNLFTKKSLAYSFILGALSMFILAFASISKMMLDASKISGTPYFEIITNYYFRFDSPLNLYSWVNYFGTSFDLSHRDMMVGDNTNNIGYYALVSIAFIYSMLPSKNTKDNAINIVLLTLTLFFGIITKSRTFIVVFALVTVIYFLFLLIQKQSLEYKIL